MPSPAWRGSNTLCDSGRYQAAIFLIKQKSTTSISKPGVDTEPEPSIL